MKDAGTPLCTRCIEPVGPLDYYCRKCGQVVGQYTTYLPYINIPFEADCLAAAWRRVWRRDGNVGIRLLCLIAVVLLAPVLFLMLPLILCDRLRRPG